MEMSLDTADMISLVAHCYEGREMASMAIGDCT